MRYFSGSGLGTVKAAAASDFKALVDRYLNMPVMLPLTRAQYSALSEKEQHKAKKVPYLCAATFAESPASKRMENAQACNLIFLDVDTAKDGTSPALPLVHNPDVLARQLEPFAWAAYHTASSTPERPRCRIVVAAQGIPVEDYPAACHTIAKRLGLPAVTRESLVPTQAMYLPSLFAGQDPETEHPLFASVTDGREFAPHDIDGSAALPAEAHRRVRGSKDGDNSDLLMFLRPPVEEITLEIAAEALEHLDPDCDYRDWLEVAAALRHQFPDDPDELLAYNLFDTWSSAGSKYVSHEETWAKFQSFTPNASGRVPVTIRSLLHKATLNGWHNGSAKDRCFKATQKWASEVESGSTLLAEGLKRVLATPLLSQSEEEALLHHIAVQAKRRFSLQVSITALRKDLSALRQQQKAKEQDVTKATTPGWVKGICYVASTQEFFRHNTGERMKGEAFDAIYSRKLLQTEEMLKGSGVHATPAALAKTWIRPTDYALNLVKVTTVYDYDYNPSAPGEVFVLEGGKAYVNTYVRCHPSPEKSRAAHAGALFMGHLTNLIAEEDYRRTLMDYLAFQVQSPGIKCRWTLLLQGGQGCGKTFLADAMGIVLGQRHVASIRGQALFTAYNEWATGYQLVAFEEVRVAGQSRYEVMNVLKPLITNSRISVSEKFRNVREVENRTNYMLFTNHHDSLAVSADDRRYFVLKSPLQTKEQIKALGEGYFLALYEMLRDDAGGLRSFFEDWEISPDFDPNGHAPDTIYLTQLMHDSANETTEAVRRIIADGDHPLVKHDLISGKVLLEVLHNEEGLRKVSAQTLAAVLRDENYIHHGRYRVNGERHHLWTCRDWKSSLSPEAEANARLVSDNYDDLI